MSNVKIKPSKIIYGMMGLGGGWDKKSIEKRDYIEAQYAIEAALEIGINYFDHANIYQFGKSEKVFGQYLNSNKNLRENIIIQSKVGIEIPDNGSEVRYNLSYNYIIDEVSNILKRLNTEYLDCLLLHRPDPLMDSEDISSAINFLFKNGMIRDIGVSNMSYHQIQLIESYIERPIKINQLEMSLLKLDWLNSGVEFNSKNSSSVDFPVGTVEHCMRKGIMIQAWGSMAGGVFTGKNIKDAPENIVRTSKLINDIALKQEVSPESVVLAWLMKHPAKISPVIGTTNPSRIKAIQYIDEVKLSREEWYELYISSRGNKLP